MKTFTQRILTSYVLPLLIAPLLSGNMLVIAMEGKKVNTECSFIEQQHLFNTTYILPSQEKLTEVINKCMSDEGYFTKKTNIVSNLAGQTLIGLKIGMQVEFAIGDYYEYLKKNSHPMILNASIEMFNLKHDPLILSIIEASTE